MQPLLKWKINKHYIFCVSVALVTQHAQRRRRAILHMWHVCLYHIVPHYLKSHDLQEKLLNIKCVL